MAADPTITGVRSPQITYDGQPLTPFAGVTVTDPTPGAIDTVDFGVFPVGASLEDGAGYDGLKPQPFDLGGAHIGSFYMLQGTASQVTAELDALILTPSSADYPTQIGINFGVDSSSGASSPASGITVDNSSVKPDAEGVIDVDAQYQTVYLQPFDIAFNHHEAHTTFVFSPGDELDVVHGFRLRGAGHDTISLPSSDFANVADVLRNTGDVGGSAFITDPRTGDALRLAGVTTAELKAHPKDFAFDG